MLLDGGDVKRGEAIVVDRVHVGAERVDLGLRVRVVADPVLPGVEDDDEPLSDDDEPESLDSFGVLDAVVDDAQDAGLGVRPRQRLAHPPEAHAYKGEEEEGAGGVPGIQEAEGEVQRREEDPKAARKDQQEEVTHEELARQV